MTTIPTLQELKATVYADLIAEFGVPADPAGQKFLEAIAGNHANNLYPIWLAVGEAQKNGFPDTADAFNTLRQGLYKLGRLPFPATQGQYTCTVTGTAGATIDASTTFKSDDTSQNPGKLYVLDTAFTFTGSSGSITLRALTAGVGAVLSIGDTLTSTSPLILASSTATVSAVAVAPVDGEPFETYRANVLLAFRTMAGSWSAVDYRLVGKNVNGVANIYAYAYSGHSNEILCYIEALTADSVGPPYKGVPTGTIITNVTNAIELVRPLDIELVHYLAIKPQTIVLNVAGSSFSTAQRRSILSAIVQYLAGVRPFIGAADVYADKLDSFSTNSAISIILGLYPGSVFGAVTMTVAGTPLSSYEFDDGEIPYMDSTTGVTFI